MQEQPDKPNILWLTDKMWACCHDLEEVLPCFQGISGDITKIAISCKLENVEIDVNPREWNNYTQQNEASSNEDETSISLLSWDERLTGFQKLILIKCFKEEKVCCAIHFRNILNYANII